ncbi:hypothetical protein EV2_045171 [Malus domestica]
MTETSIHPQDQNLSIPPHEVTSTFPLWEVELDAFFFSPFGEVGPSTTTVEFSVTSVVSSAFAKLQELLSLSA